MMKVELKKVEVGQEVVIISGSSVFEAKVIAQNGDGTTSLIRTSFGKNQNPAKNLGFKKPNWKEVAVK